MASREIHTDFDFKSVARILNLQDAVAAQEPATFAQLKAQAEGISWKAHCRAASTGNVTVAAPGANIDGVAMAAGDRYLAKNQTAPAEDGIYIWNGAATPATRALDLNAGPDFLAATVSISEGTVNADTTWMQTATAIVVGTTAQTWVAFGATVPVATTAVQGKVQLATTAEATTGTDTAKAITAAALAGSVWAKLKAAGTIGDGSATSFTITHNLGTLDVICQVFRNSGSGDEIICEVDHTSVNVTTIKFDDVPTAAQYRYVIIG